MLEIEGINVEPSRPSLLTRWRGASELPTHAKSLFHYSALDEGLSQEDSLVRARSDKWMDVTKRYHLPDIAGKREDITQEDIDSFKAAIESLPLSTLRFMHGLMQPNEAKGVIRGAVSAVFKESKTSEDLMDIDDPDSEISIIQGEPIWELHFTPTGDLYRGRTKEERRANVFLFATDMLRMIDYMKKRKITLPKMLFGKTNIAMAEFLKTNGFRISSIDYSQTMADGMHFDSTSDQEELTEIKRQMQEAMEEQREYGFSMENEFFDIHMFLPLEELLSPAFEERMRNIQLQVYQRLYDRER